MLIKICKVCVKAILCTSISHMYIHFLCLVNSQPVFRSHSVYSKVLDEVAMQQLHGKVDLSHVNM